MDGFFCALLRILHLDLYGNSLINYELINYLLYENYIILEKINEEIRQGHLLDLAEFSIPLYEKIIPINNTYIWLILN